MLRFKFGAWAVVLMLAALSFGACSDEDDDPAFNPPSNITEALKQLYQHMAWLLTGYHTRCVLCGRLLGGR